MARLLMKATVFNDSGCEKNNALDKNAPMVWGIFLHVIRSL